MNKLRPLLGDLNNADQMIVGVRDALNSKKAMDHDGMVKVQELLSRAIELFRSVEDGVLQAITDNLSEAINAIPDSEDEPFNWAKEQGDIDHDAGKSQTEMIYARRPY